MPGFNNVRKCLEHPLLHVISGQGLQSYDGRTIELKPGMTIRIPARVKHNMVNTGTELLRTVISFSSGDRQTIQSPPAAPWRLARRNETKTGAKTGLG